ncbi:MAG: homocysteine S-methyltransferase family protein [Candidatus Kariarchaeaceae archaeon]|jgi:S-methylmethionine-dependent homocysteine/selenocysteine methylase
MNITDAIAQTPFIIAEGSLIERLNRDPKVELDPNILHASLIYDVYGATVLDKLYREYIDIGQQYNLPIIVCTATWRANPERLKKSGYSISVNKDCYQFLDTIRNEYGEFSNQIYVGGLIGCRGDAYNAEEGLSTENAYLFHQSQIKALADTGVDFLIAETLPALGEALGIAQVMAETGLPYILSFVIRETGVLLDDTPLHEAIKLIDDNARKKPICYLINCTHPSKLEKAILLYKPSADFLLQRVFGLLANASTKEPEELESLSYLDSENPDDFSKSMIKLHKKFGMKIFGGCCGTDYHHIQSIAEQIEQVNAKQ